uniref:Small ribosomal subunit protein uS8c n=1 Tax=Selaginella doederleinii TaxID=186426 RepID=A0A482CFK9_9TRAC|nr:ribosomal protein S8 [Selaginella doederleinii]QBL76040.1 ribosomal protein S8 [Selaginella doederleinii]
MGNDAIDETITAPRNAGSRRADTVRISSTNTTINTGRVPVEEGYSGNPREHRQGTNRLPISTSRYRGRMRKARITTCRRISKPGLRVYTGYKDIPKVPGGLGTVIPPTPGGMTTDREARQKRIGGEVPRHVWR